MPNEGEATLDILRSRGPQRKIEIEQPIFMGVHEVTQKQYETVMGNNPSLFAMSGADPQYSEKVADLDTSNHPVENMSWNDAAEFLRQTQSARKIQAILFSGEG